jgi:hypothetical protein
MMQELTSILAATAVSTTNFNPIIDITSNQGNQANLSANNHQIIDSYFKQKDGIYEASKEDILKELSKNNQVLLFGDTKHSNPAIKKTVFDMLDVLQEQGYNAIWLEIDKKRQDTLNNLLANNPTYEEILDWVPAKNNKDIFANGILCAHNLGMYIGLIDDKTKLNEFRNANPEFIEIQSLYRKKFAEGLGILEAENAALDGKTEDEKTMYREKN